MASNKPFLFFLRFDDSLLQTLQSLTFLALTHFLTKDKILYNLFFFNLKQYISQLNGNVRLKLVTEQSQDKFFEGGSNKK